MSTKPCAFWPPARPACAGHCGRHRRRHAYVIIGGTLIPVDRLAADRPFYSGKHKKHGMNLQFTAGPEGEPVLSFPVTT